MAFPSSERKALPLIVVAAAAYRGCRLGEVDL